MLETNLCGIKLKNPTVLASGILGISKESAERIAEGGAGAVTLKSLCHEERSGHPAPNMFAIQGGFLNAVGLPGQGLANAKEDFKQLDDLSIPIIGSIFAYKVEQFSEVTKQMAALKPAMIEIDISCPHMDYAKPFFADPELIRQITKLVKENSGEIPVSTKLSPNVHNIAELAIAAEQGGADCITAINTTFGMKIDLETGIPILGNKTGGLSGPAIKPIAVKCVYDIYKSVNIPIIGTGGITDGEDAIEMIMAGATALGVGTAVYYHGPDVFRKICREMFQWLERHNIRSLAEIRGKAHES